MPKETKIILLISGLILGGVFWLAARTSQQVNQPADPALLVRDNSHMTGPKNAIVTLVEFGDYQCPACAYQQPILKQIAADYKDKSFNFVFRHFPLPSHSNAQAAARAAEAAGEQGKFWAMHDKLYESQAQWSGVSDPTDLFSGYAQLLGLDTEQFKATLTSKKLVTAIQEDMTDSNALGVNSTPTLYLNGTKYVRILTAEELKQKIDELLAKPAQQ